MYNIRMNTMLGTNHSWAVVMRGLAREFISLNNNISLKTTNGTKDIPVSLHKYLNKDKFIADLDMCYTLPRNFRARFKKDSVLKAAIYNYETDILPKEWANHVSYVDYVFPSSNFTKDIFIKNGWPEDKCVVIPHGINIEDFKDKSRCIFSTEKKFKFLNVSIPHHRKNINIIINSYYDAFGEDDDVCLILKTSLKKPRLSFECDVKDIIIKAQRKFSGKPLPQIEVITKNFNSMIPVYNSVDALINASSSEGFGLPMLEAISAKKIVIAPNVTGQIDFLNDKNSILYGADKVYAKKGYQYWRPSKGAMTYMPSGSELSESMLYVYNNYNDLLKKFENNMIKTSNEFTWTSSCNKILDLL